MTKPSVLVTGAAGYLGRLTVAALAERRDELRALVALDVTPARGEDERVTWVQGDICAPGLGDLLAEHRIDTVIHLASIVRTPPGAPPDLAYRVDVEGSTNLLTASVAAGVRRFIVTSSGAAYGYHPDNPDWLSEDDPLRGNEHFPYARHKRLVEEILARFRSEHPEMCQLVLRPGTVVGEGVRSPVTDLFEGRVVLGIRGSDSPFVFIWDQDVVACILAGVFQGKEGVFNLAGDGALTPRELARLMGKPFLPLPAGLVRLALRILRGLGLSEHGPEQLDFLRYRPVLCNRRLKEEFPYQPRLSSREAFELYAKSRGLMHG